MIKYQAAGMDVTAYGGDAFWIDLGGIGTPMARGEMEDIRAIIDQALNTSAEELEASEAERERQRYAKVDPARRIENAFVSAGEACGIRDASKALDT